MPDLHQAGAIHNDDFNAAFLHVVSEILKPYTELWPEKKKNQSLLAPLVFYLCWKYGWEEYATFLL